jgi:hypothetical protein
VSVWHPPLEQMWGCIVMCWESDRQLVYWGMCLQEILLAIKLVKFYTWESSFSKQVNEVCGTCGGRGLHIHAETQQGIRDP